MKRLITTTALTAALAIGLITGQAKALDVTAAGGGNQQVYQLGDGNALGLIGLYNYGGVGATIAPSDISDALKSGGTIQNLYFGPMINYQGQGAWAGNPANFTPFDSPTQVAGDNSGRLFDSVWVEWDGNSNLVWNAPGGGTSTLQNSPTLQGDPLPDDVSPQAVPEPVTSTLAMLGLTSLGLTATRRRRA